MATERKFVEANGQRVSKVALLSALHNGTRPVGMGNLWNIGEMSLVQAEDYLLNQNFDFCFDYVHGRPIKVFEVDGVVQRADLYDRDAGDGAFERAVAKAVELTKLGAH